MKTRDLIFGLMAALGKPSYSFSVLFRLTRLFGITDTNFRTTLSRMIHDRLIMVRQEQSIRYSFTEKTVEISRNVSRGFDALDWTGWDGTWWGVPFSVPALEKKHRYRIRKKLKAYRFAPLYPGFWIKPGHPSETNRLNLGSILIPDVANLIQFVFETPPSVQLIEKMWHLDQLMKSMVEGLHVLEKSHAALCGLDSKTAFTEHFQLGAGIVSILSEDPLLPPEFLPDDWPGDTLRKTFKVWNAQIMEHAESLLSEMGHSE